MNDRLSRVALGLYSSAWLVALPPLLPLLLLHPRLRGALWQRLGGPRHRVPSLEGRPVWFHGASAGDVVALTPLVERFRRRGVPAVLSSWTRSGHQLAATRLPADTPIFRTPLDLALPVRSVLSRWRPRLLVLECLELWPRLVHCCIEEQIPVAVINGRLSERSLRRYQRVRRLFEPCFRGLSLVTALDDEHAAHFVAAGTPPERVFVVGSSKHGNCGSVPGAPPSVRLRLVLGSVHPAEEQLLLRWLPQLYAEFPDLQILIAPRYPHHAGRSLRRLTRLGVAAHPLSRCGTAAWGEAPAIVVDEMGVLHRCYAGARAAFVGGSLVPRGGHNVVEPAACGVAVLTGPHVANCRQEVERLVRAGAATVVGDGAAFYHAARALLRDVDGARHAGRAALEVARTLAGEADRISDLLLPLMM